MDSKAEEIAMILNIQLGSDCVKESLTCMRAVTISGNETTRLEGMWGLHGLK